MICDLIRAVKSGDNAEKSKRHELNDALVRTIITLILCIYECICYFQACNHVIYESNALYKV